jgi:hypothetical protein
MKKVRPDLPNATLFSILTENTYDESTGEEFNEFFGYGIANAREAVAGVKNLFCDDIYGDINCDCYVNNGDIKYLTNWLYHGGPTPFVDSTIIDVNGDCDINAFDITYLIVYVFLGGPEPVEGCSSPDAGSMAISLQNHPNPFNASTIIEFNLPAASDWNLEIYNILGQKVTEYTGHNDAGPVKIEWEGKNIASGVYFYKIEAGEYINTKKMILLK